MVFLSFASGIGGTASATSVLVSPRAGAPTACDCAHSNRICYRHVSRKTAALGAAALLIRDRNVCASIGRKSARISDCFFTFNILELRFEPISVGTRNAASRSGGRESTARYTLVTQKSECGPREMALGTGWAGS